MENRPSRRRAARRFRPEPLSDGKALKEGKKKIGYQARKEEEIGSETVERKEVKESKDCRKISRKAKNKRKGKGRLKAKPN